MTRPCQTIKHARSNGRNMVPPASSTVACCCCFAAAIFWTSLIHSALGHPTSSSSPPTTAAARVGEIDAPSNQLGSDELTPDDSSLLTLADQEVVFTPHIRSVDGGAAPRKPHQLLPGVRVQGSAEDRDPSAAAAAAERCPRPAYPINRATYCSPELRRCSRDEECGGSGSASACCFNGCIFTCMVPMDAPPNFDWVEETVSKIQPYGGSATHLDLEVPPVKYDDPNVRTAVGDDAAADECHLSASQYKSLQDFRNHDGIRECFCEDGQILCKVGRA